jgi:hypothetical protein
MINSCSGMGLPMRLKAVVRFAVPGFLLAMAGACDCAPNWLEQRTSPSKEFVAGVYARECGPVAPNNLRVAIRRANDESFADVATLEEAPFDAHLEWAAPDVLRVTFDCPRDGAACDPPRNRNWDVVKSVSWRGIEIEYSLSPGLQRELSGDERARVLR